MGPRPQAPQACPCFALFVSTRPDLLNQLGSSTFLSALLALLHILYMHTCAQRGRPSGGGRICGVIVDRSSRLMFRLSGYILKPLQINVTSASTRALDEGGRVRGGRELARLWAELSDGPLEKKILNIQYTG